MRDRPPAPPPPRPFELDPTRVEVRPEPPAHPPPLDLDPAAVIEPDEANVTILPPRRRRRRGWRARLAGLFGVGLLGAFAFQTVDYAGDLIAESPLLGWPFTAFLVMLVTAAIGWTGMEMREFRRLSARATLRRDAERLAASDLHGEAEPLLAQVTAELGGREELAPALARFEASATDALGDAERLRLYEMQVLAPADRAAYRIVLAGGRDIGILTALSPLGLL
ncbi:MAG TPA: hypothetical protein VF606_01785, partial [Geminicoccaceae bacterium]